MEGNIEITETEGKISISRIKGTVGNKSTSMITETKRNISTN